MTRYRDCLNFSPKMIFETINYIMANPGKWARLYSAIEGVFDNDAKIIPLKKTPEANTLDKCRVISLLPTRTRFKEGQVASFLKEYP